jgi:hypothetical protein
MVLKDVNSTLIEFRTDSELRLGISARITKNNDFLAQVNLEYKDSTVNIEDISPDRSLALIREYENYILNKNESSIGSGWKSVVQMLRDIMHFSRMSKKISLVM